ncbi:ChaC-like protein [Jimgerdemannia flammicorona]|uniref:glutathione-specific gamma-glutamylcyclotransferase n=1 Tax=Jimgerdemannia flammicorona TaxID=994334 RepID=A0A433A072_9FUNG|nr:ChaC-like protein [Jimgerdemannia flammicorona]
MSSAPAPDSTTSAPGEEVWVFGYGSLVWKPPIAVVGYVKQYVRRFWQVSRGGRIDHRGTLDAPGRVVTLIPLEEWRTLKDHHAHKDDDVTWGVAFKIPESDVETTRAYLDHREKNGYTVDFLDVYQNGQEEPVVRKHRLCHILWVEVYLAINSLELNCTSRSQAMVYIATTNNESYVGPAPVDEIALQIYKSYGIDQLISYLTNLAST